MVDAGAGVGRRRSVVEWCEGERISEAEVAVGTAVPVVTRVLLGNGVGTTPATVAVTGWLAEYAGSDVEKADGGMVIVGNMVGATIESVGTIMGDVGTREPVAAVVGAVGTVVGTVVLRGADIGVMVATSVVYVAVRGAGVLVVVVLDGAHTCEPMSARVVDTAVLPSLLPPTGLACTVSFPTEMASPSFTLSLILSALSDEFVVILM